MLILIKHLAAALDMKEDTLRKHIYRQKLFKSGKYIDTDFAPNKDYILDQTDGRGIDVSKIPNSENTKPKPVPNGPNVELPKTEIPENNFGKEVALSIQKKYAELIKIKNDNRLSELKIAKAQGELMPMDLVQKILSINIQNIIREFENTAENIATVYCEQMGGNREQLTEMLERMRQQLQETILKTKEIAALEITQSINQFAQTRFQGERK